MLVAMARLIRTEVSCVELAVLRMDAWPRSDALVDEPSHDLRVRRAHATGELHWVPLGVATLGRERFLVERRQRRPVLIDAATDALGKDLGRVGDVSDHLDRGPGTESRGSQTFWADRPHDARERRGVIREGECAVLVVCEPIHTSLHCRKGGISPRTATPEMNAVIGDAPGKRVSQRLIER